MRAVMDQAAVQRFIAAPSGPVSNDLRRRGQNVRRAQQRLMPVRSGRTRDNVTIRERRSSAGLVVQVGVWPRSEKDAPPVVLERGSEKHEIRARRAKVLMFQKGGKVYFRRVVQHPGTPAFRPFSRSLRAARR